MTMNINFSELTNEELQKIIDSAKNELDSRIEKKYTIYTHDCKGSAKHHLGKYKHYAKLLTGIDTTKTNGYAYIGDFLFVTAEHRVPINSIIIECCGYNIIAYRITENGKEKIDEATLNTQSAMIERLSKLIA